MNVKVANPKCRQTLSVMAVTNQPGKFQPSDFQTDVCDCCDDVKICLCGCFCYLCLGCTIASDMGECCMFGTGYPIRSVYRTRYNIKGSMCNDCLMSLFCPVCSTCQLKRDIKHRKEQGTF
uniref:Placenta associated 8, tandem duplicate 1 n=1 Tax=Oryzias latipes TaxID=8090 RepID=A0A3P9MB91_ORYLA